MLRIAWFINSKENELIAYDQLGIQHFHIGNIQISNFYHNKMLFGDYEKDNSEIKKLGIAKVKNKIVRTQGKILLKKLNQEDLEYFIISSSDEEFEMPQNNQVNIDSYEEVFKEEQQKYDPYKVLNKKEFVNKEIKKFSLYQIRNE